MSHAALHAATVNTTEPGRCALPAKYEDESACVRRLLEERPFDRSAAAAVAARAAGLVAKMRQSEQKLPLVDTFLKEYGLSNQEGVALMCLAESLLRVPDSHTADQLIADKLALGDWDAHLGSADELLVNVSTWGLILTGSLVAVEPAFATNPRAWLRRLAGRVGEPIIRRAMRSAMHILGKAFVLGRTIEEALSRSDRGPYSYDMLGEAARERHSAKRYRQSYAAAIEAVGRHAIEDASVSIKLSALHPRFEESQRERVLDELQATVVALCEAARRQNVAITIDAEEADRLQLTLDLFQRLCRDERLQGWDGLGIVVQAYSKRALALLQELLMLARFSGRTIPVRLVKGAYWDAEIKQAQIAGVDGFPVFTRKENTDLSYLVCAGFLLSQRRHLRPQFATHNAHTIAAVMHLAGGGDGFEFQRLHGMGEQVYAAAAVEFEDFPTVRTYAPVGGYRELLAYLVRRLLENGANSSFVNRFLDADETPESLCADPVEKVAGRSEHGHPRIALPRDIFAPSRANSRGIDLSDAAVLEQLEACCAEVREPLSATSLVNGRAVAGEEFAVRNPARTDEIVGHYQALPVGAVAPAVDAARSGFGFWRRCSVDERASALERTALLLEESHPEFLALLVREAGKTFDDAVAELREAVDFCRYYAAQAREKFDGATVLPGPTGERNSLSVDGRGVFVTISPWNFPLAIFVGQVAAALVMGNAVVAKPAEETPLVAYAAVKLMHRAGVPEQVLHLVLGGRELGAALVAHPGTNGVAFTGSTSAGSQINRALAVRNGPIVPLVAETGGQNVMFVDSTALLEQVTDDVIASAFHSAGQRCSAARVLYVQSDIADPALEMIRGAMDELRVGDPACRSTDLGPVISAAAAQRLRKHVKSVESRCRRAHCRELDDAHSLGHFVAPTLLEIDSIGRLEQENFGPILHVIRFAAQDIDRLLSEVAATGYGLTMGLHSRIEGRWQSFADRGLVGNLYVNRDMVGAVVGSQPFGGQGLSGTGPKAGGPNYLMRFATERTFTVNTVATGGNAELLSIASATD